MQLVELGFYVDALDDEEADHTHGGKNEIAGDIASRQIRQHARNIAEKQSAQGVAGLQLA